jgi:16S rRNA (cytidine1402-2'-O)-methyltransferase
VTAASGEGRGSRGGAKTAPRVNADAKTGTLYVVATPIGHMGDITQRAIDTLRAAGVVVAEDTRRTRALLEQLGIQGKRLVSFHAHSTQEDLERALASLDEGDDVAFATDAGTPLVSDPGSALVRGAEDRGAPVVPIPGPSAVLGALVKSGLATDAGFRFVAFLPREGSSRRDAILRVAETAEPVVLFEAANRLRATLVDLAEAMPHRAACVVRELTKVHEEAVSGPLAELANDRREWRGEITVVLGAYVPEDRAAIGEEAIDERIALELSRGVHAKAIAERLAAWSGRPRRELYARVVAMKDKAR